MSLSDHLADFIVRYLILLTIVMIVFNYIYIDMLGLSETQRTLAAILQLIIVLFIILTRRHLKKKKELERQKSLRDKSTNSEIDLLLERKEIEQYDNDI